MKKLLKFSAKWCGPCKMIAPLIDSYKDRATIETVDIDDNPKKTVQHGVTAVPTIIIVNEDGVETHRGVGQSVNKRFLDEALAE